MTARRHRHLSLLALSLGALAACERRAESPTISDLPEAVRAIEATGFRGSMWLLNGATGEYQTAGSVEGRRIPASTFKILNSLIAIETGVVEGPSSVLAWDGVERSRPEINRDLALPEAFQLSAVPHYQAIARAIGADRMQEWVDRVGYGNRDITGGIDVFWLTGGLRISPKEQVDFLKRLYDGTLPFAPETMAAVRDIMRVEETEDYVLRAKTGWGVPPGTEEVGWWVGWVESGEGVTFFATLLESPDPGDGFGPARIEATRQVLKAIGVLPSAS